MSHKRCLNFLTQKRNESVKWTWEHWIAKAIAKLCWRVFLLYFIWSWIQNIGIHWKPFFFVTQTLRIKILLRSVVYLHILPSQFILPVVIFILLAKMCWYYDLLKPFQKCLCVNKCTFFNTHSDSRERILWETGKTGGIKGFQHKSFIYLSLYTCGKKMKRAELYMQKVSQRVNETREREKKASLEDACNGNTKHENKIRREKVRIKWIPWINWGGTAQAMIFC